MSSVPFNRRVPPKGRGLFKLKEDRLLQNWARSSEIGPCCHINGLCLGQNSNNIENDPVLKAAHTQGLPKNRDGREIHR